MVHTQPVNKLDVKRVEFSRWQASGGVSSLDDIKALKAINCDSVILGKSLLTNQFTLEDALACWQSE